MSRKSSNELISNAKKASRTLADKSFRAAILEASTIQNELIRTSMFLEIAHQFPDELLDELTIHVRNSVRDELYAGTLIKLKDVTDDRERYELFIDFVRQMQNDQFNYFLSAAELISNFAYRIKALGKIIPYAPKERKGEILQEILQNAKQTRNQYVAADLLIDISEELPVNEQVIFLDASLRIARTLEDINLRVKLLSKLPKYMLHVDEILLVRDYEDSPQANSIDLK